MNTIRTRECCCAGLDALVWLAGNRTNRNLRTLVGIDASKAEGPLGSGPSREKVHGQCADGRRTLSSNEAY